MQGAEVVHFHTVTYKNEYAGRLLHLQRLILIFEIAVQGAEVVYVHTGTWLNDYIFVFFIHDRITLFLNFLGQDVEAALYQLTSCDKDYYSIMKVYVDVLKLCVKDYKLKRNHK